MSTVRVKSADRDARISVVGASEPDEWGGINIPLGKLEQAAALGFKVCHLHEDPDVPKEDGGAEGDDATNGTEGEKAPDGEQKPTLKGGRLRRGKNKE